MTAEKPAEKPTIEMTLHPPGTARRLGQVRGRVIVDPSIARYKDVSSTRCIECAQPITLRPEKTNGWLCDGCEGKPIDAREIRG